METHVTRQPVFGELRQHVLLPLIIHPLFSEAEQLRANHFVHEIDDIARLTRWGTNVLAEIARRQTEAARQRRELAMGATLRQLGSTSFRGHRSRSRRPGCPVLSSLTGPTGRPAPSTAWPSPASSLRIL